MFKPGGEDDLDRKRAADMKRETEVRTARPPLFPLWVLFLVAALLEIGLLLWAWPMTVIRGVPWRWVIFSAAAVFTTVYVIGEPIRYRWRITLKLLLAVMTLIAIGCGLFGQRLAKLRQQQRAVREIQASGGYIQYDIDYGWGTSFKTRDGWMFPRWMVDALGKDLFGRVVRVAISTDGNVDRVLVLAGQLDHLEELGLTDCQFSDESLSSLKRVPTLRRVYLWKTSVTDAGVAHLADLPELESLGITGSHITSAALADLKRLSRLASLNLENTDVDDAGLAHLASMGQLSHLHLKGCLVSDAGLKHLQPLESLTYLDLTDTRVTDEGLEFLSSIRSLSRLALDGTDVTDAGLIHLKGLTNLTSLSLGSTNIQGLEFAQLAALPRLESLSLDQARITDQGLENLQGFRTLSSLYISQTPITDAGLEHLTGLPSLSELSLMQTGITDAGLQILPRYLALRRVYLRGTNITNNGMLQLMEALPICECLP